MITANFLHISLALLLLPLQAMSNLTLLDCAMRCHVTPCECVLKEELHAEAPQFLKLVIW